MFASCLGALAIVASTDCCMPGGGGGGNGLPGTTGAVNGPELIASELAICPWLLLLSDMFDCGLRVLSGGGIGGGGCPVSSIPSTDGVLLPEVIVVRERDLDVATACSSLRSGCGPGVVATASCSGLLG
eukprot:3339134-Amphidinium_carterae.1